jgi:hypothetical protein
MPQKKINAYRKRKSFSIGHGDSGEQCGPWASCSKIDNIKAYDFSTLYTTIPHNK